MSFDDVFKIKIWTLSLHNWNSVVYNQVYGSHVSTYTPKKTAYHCHRWGVRSKWILSNNHLNMRKFMPWKFRSMSENVRKKLYGLWFSSTNKNIPLKSCVLLMIFRFLVTLKCLLFDCFPSINTTYLHDDRMFRSEESEQTQYWLERKQIICVICHNYLNTKKRKDIQFVSNLYVMSGWVLFWFFLSQKRRITTQVMNGQNEMNGCH